MRAFADLLDRLILTRSRNAKLDALARYFAATPDPDRGAALAAIAGDLTFNAAKPALLRKLAAERVDPDLFALSYDYVGDLAETVALIWPTRPGANRSPSLGEVYEALTLAGKLDAPRLIEGWLDALDASERWALLKLVTGGLRIGAGARLAKQALAQWSDRPLTEIEEIWHGLEPPYRDLFAWLESRGEKPAGRARAPFRPVMLAHALEEADQEKLDARDFAAEWKWDGVRVQAVSDQGVRRLYTRNGEDVSAAFPDLIDHLAIDGAVDGELLVRDGEALGSFNDLQQRLNRKRPDAKIVARFPAFVRAYDILADRDQDVRALPFRDRRALLEMRIAEARSPRLDLSPMLAAQDWDALAALRAGAAPAGVEGLMLKRWDSRYEIGRPRGLWWKWKRDPFRIDAVLMYAQRGHGKRSSLYSDFTFGVWRGAALTPVGKAYFGFTDAELAQLDKFVRDNETERFGPVRAVRADADFGLVLEIAFEGLARSTRHKSGVAMRFPRIARIRWDKPAAEADRIETLEALLRSNKSSSEGA
ncbi:MAG: cisplatin damage response ATP-dependent DNA ligase [Alphaproteobacteria bacterium]|nr:cisplatin damage response ATP-dependent DNA ligase [Alphaproteobacteria bacterium]